MVDDSSLDYLMDLIEEQTHLTTSPNPMAFSTASFLQLVLLMEYFVSGYGQNETACDAYLTVEEKFECGEEGYPVGFGYKNCMSFNNAKKYGKFNAAGKKFIGCTVDCLIKSIQNISETVSTCDEVKTDAFDSHVECYLKCNFCKICSSNFFALANTYDWSDFFSVLAMKQVAQIIAKCPAFSCIF